MYDEIVCCIYTYIMTIYLIKLIITYIKKCTFSDDFFQYFDFKKYCIHNNNILQNYDTRLLLLTHQIIACCT